MFVASPAEADGVGGLRAFAVQQATRGPQRDVLALSFEISSVRCPGCGWCPDATSRWECTCGFNWNTFGTGARCPACELTWAETECLAYARLFPHKRWYATP
jgi:hypothetical protein